MQWGVAELEAGKFPPLASVGREQAVNLPRSLTRLSGGGIADAGGTDPEAIRSRHCGSLIPAALQFLGGAHPQPEDGSRAIHAGPMAA